MNKFRVLAALSAAVMLASMAGCNKNNGGSSYSSDKKGGSAQNTAPTYLINPEVEAASDGPRLYMKDAKAHPGETVEITMAVENADEKWNMCGIHVTYPDFLKCVIRDEEQGFVKYKKGEACEYSTGSVGMIWREGLPDELTARNEGCVFFTTVFDGDLGGEGDVVTFYFDVPMDAQKGEYPLGFYYRDTDKFIDSQNNRAMEKYVFENWKFGTLTIE